MATSDDAATAAQVHAMVSPDSRIVVVHDGDGAAGLAGVVERVFRSGRCQVRLDRGDLGNLPMEWVRPE